MDLSDTFRIALFFDTFERTGFYLEAWLFDVIRGVYGEVPSDIIVSIAGQNRLSSDRWSALERHISRVELDVFSEEEARTFLERHQLNDEQVISTILQLSGRLPLLLATLAARRPGHWDDIGDASGTAVDRFLKWVDTSERDAILLASVPRYINHDILAATSPERPINNLYSLLEGMPFLQKRQNGHRFHELVRIQMLQFLHRTSPNKWSEVHARLAQHYENCCDNLSKITEEQKFWMREAVYHRICQNHVICRENVLKEFFKSWAHQKSDGLLLAQAIEDGERDSNIPEKERIGCSLVELCQNSINEGIRAEITLLTQILEFKEIDTRTRFDALSKRASLYRKIRKPRLAIRDIDSASSLWECPTEARQLRQLTSKASCLLQLERFNEAIDELNRAIEIKPDFGLAYALRGYAFSHLNYHDRTLNDLEKARSLHSGDIQVLEFAGLIYMGLKAWKEAETVYNDLIDLDPTSFEYFLQRGLVSVEIEHWEQARRDIEKSISLGLNPSTMPATLAYIYRKLGDFDRSLRLYQEAIIETPENLDLYLAIFDINLAREDLDEAYTTLCRALEFHPDSLEILVLRAMVLQEKKQWSDALIDLDHARQAGYEVRKVLPLTANSLNHLGRFDEEVAIYDELLNRHPEAEDKIDWEHSRALALSWDGRFAQAITVFERFASASPDKLHFNYNLAVALTRHRGLSQAADTIARIKRLLTIRLADDPGDAPAIYAQAGLYALQNENDLALQLLENTIEREPECVHWARYDHAWSELRSDPRFSKLLTITRQ